MESISSPPQRRHPRLGLALTVVDKRASQGQAPAVTRDVSLGGMFLKTGWNRLVGDRLVLQLTVPGVEAPLELSAEVLRAEQRGPHQGIAVRFLVAGEAQKSFLEAQLSRLYDQLPTQD